MGSCSPDIDAANAMAPLIMVLMILFGGFYIHCYVISDSLKIVVIYIESICIIIKHIHSLSLSLCLKITAVDHPELEMLEIGRGAMF